MRIVKTWNNVIIIIICHATECDIQSTADLTTGCWRDAQNDRQFSTLLLLCRRRRRHRLRYDNCEQSLDRNDCRQLQRLAQIHRLATTVPLDWLQLTTWQYQLHACWTAAVLYAMQPLLSYKAIHIGSGGGNEVGWQLESTYFRTCFIRRKNQRRI